MYQLQLTEFTQAEFLANYWQQKPVVIRQGFVDFVDPVTPDELAGFASEPKVESRLIAKKDGQWQADFGPFDDYQHLGERDWSLVVQALDHWSEDAAQLIEPFRFVPHWRLDDVMVSFATPGGSVGPHIDLYDVFICQGQGRRRWRVGDKGNHQQFSVHEALLHVADFEAIIDVELEPGDILYIPPGFPHDGVALENSMSFSVGFRATSRVNLFSGFADFLIDNELGEELIEDAGRSVSAHAGAIDSQDYQRIKSQFTDLLANDQLFRQFAGNYFSQAKHELDLQPIDEAYLPEDISQLLSENSLLRLGGLRAFYFPETLAQGVCYIDGVEYQFAPELAPAIQQLCDHAVLPANTFKAWLHHQEFLTFMVQQVNAGYWYFSETE